MLKCVKTSGLDFFLVSSKDVKKIHSFQHVENIYWQKWSQECNKVHDGVSSGQLGAVSVLCSFCSVLCSVCLSYNSFHYENYFQ